MIESILFLPMALRFNPLFIEFVINPNTCSTRERTFDLRVLRDSCSIVRG